MYRIIVAAILALGLVPSIALADTAADAMCLANWDYSVQCTYGQQKEVNGKMVIGGLDCPCTETDNGIPTSGICITSNKCLATKTNGQTPQQPTQAQQQQANNGNSANGAAAGSSGASSNSVQLPEIEVTPAGTESTIGASENGGGSLDETGGANVTTGSADQSGSSGLGSGSSILGTAYDWLTGQDSGASSQSSPSDEINSLDQQSSGEPSWLSGAQQYQLGSNGSGSSGNSSADVTSSGVPSADESVGGSTFTNPASNPMGDLNIPSQDIVSANTLTQQTPTEQAASDLQAIESTIQNDLGSLQNGAQQVGSWVDSIAFPASAGGLGTADQQQSVQALQDAAQAFGEDRGYTQDQINTIAQGLAGVADQESQLNANTACNAGGYCGLGQLAETANQYHTNETASSLNTLQGLAESPYLSPSTQADVQAAVDRINQLQSQGIDPNTDPVAGAWLLAARQAYMPEMNASPMDTAAQYASSPQTASAIMEGAQLAPAMYVNGNFDPNSQLTQSEINALSGNKISVGSGDTIGDAIAAMQASPIYSRDFNAGVAIAQSVTGTQPSEWSGMSYASLSPIGGVSSYPAFASAAADISSSYDDAQSGSGPAIAENSPPDIAGISSPTTYQPITESGTQSGLSGGVEPGTNPNPVTSEAIVPNGPAVPAGEVTTAVPYEPVSSAPLGLTPADFDARFNGALAPSSLVAQEFNELPETGTNSGGEVNAPLTNSGGGIGGEINAPLTNSGGGIGGEINAPLTNSGGGIGGEINAPLSNSGGGIGGEINAPLTNSGGGIGGEINAPLTNSGGGIGGEINAPLTNSGGGIGGEINAPLGSAEVAANQTTPVAPEPSVSETVNAWNSPDNSIATLQQYLSENQTTSGSASGLEGTQAASEEEAQVQAETTAEAQTLTGNLLPGTENEGLAFTPPGYEYDWSQPSENEALAYSGGSTANQIVSQEFDQLSQPTATEDLNAEVGGNPYDSQVTQGLLTTPPPSDQYANNYYTLGDVAPPGDNNIKNLQSDLGELGYSVSSYGNCTGSDCPGSPGNETNTFGSATYRAVEQFQADNGLTVDGKVGPQTVAAINEQILALNETNFANPVQTAPASSLTASELLSSPEAQPSTLSEDEALAFSPPGTESWAQPSENEALGYGGSTSDQTNGGTQTQGQNTTNPTSDQNSQLTDDNPYDCSGACAQEQAAQAQANQEAQAEAKQATVQNLVQNSNSAANGLNALAQCGMFSCNKAAIASGLSAADKIASDASSLGDTALESKVNQYLSLQNQMSAQYNVGNLSAVVGLRMQVLSIGQSVLNYVNRNYK